MSVPMVKLLVHREDVESGIAVFGGLPLAEPDTDFVWPHCRVCRGPMQFLGRVETELGTEQIFMCQNDPGVCEEWSSEDGANAVLVSRLSKPVQVAPPGEGVSVRSCHHGAQIVEVEADDYEQARDQWLKATGSNYQQILGQLYGSSFWLQADETPSCDHCAQPMRLVAQLEEGPDLDSTMNFGSGCAYLFDCACVGSAKFLWQC